jgi:hypothetical protein
MECKQLIRLAKDWYIRVEQETMAPARMMEFIDRHVKNCPICQAEPGLAVEIEKIRAYVLPDSKIPKAVRDNQRKPTPEISPEEHDEPTTKAPEQKR